jgi:hypothetical protein
MKEYLYNFSSLKDSELDARILKINNMINYNMSLGHTEQLQQLYDVQNSLMNEYNYRMANKKIADPKRSKYKPIKETENESNSIDIGTIEKDNNNDRPSW